MTRNFSLATKKDIRPAQDCLTEENLRMHSSGNTQKESVCHVEKEQKPVNSYDQFDYGLDDDEDERSIAMRRAASLEAMSAYGGCFASGFFAMQQPLPWTYTATNNARATTETGSVTTASSGSSNSSGYPRPDSDTLSNIDIQELEAERRWSWRSMGRGRRSAQHTSRR